MSLHAVHAPGGRVIPLPARTSGGIGDDAIALGLIRMACRAGAGLGLTRSEINALETGLQPNATREHRRAALLVLAERYADWADTPEGVAELLRLWTYLAPHVAYSTLAEIAQELAFAEDPINVYPECSRDMARDNAALLLDRASRKLTRTTRPTWWQHGPDDDGPGAA